MDVEGAERRLLRENADWLREVRSIKVVHGSYRPADCITDLESLGFDVHEVRQPRWPPSRGRPCLSGVRRSTAC
jgi:hypothetical protein